MARALHDYSETLEALGDLVAQLRARPADAGCTVGAVGIAAAAFIGST